MQWRWSWTPILLQMLAVMLPHRMIWGSSKLKLPYLSRKKQSVAFTDSEGFSTSCRGSAEPCHPSFPPLLLSLRSLTKTSSTLWHQPPQHQCLQSMGLGIRKPWIEMVVVSLISHETLLNLIFLICKNKIIPILSTLGEDSVRDSAQRSS